MIVVPNTKGAILQKLLVNRNSTPISIGDSLGDIKLFEVTKKSGGVSILHLFNKGSLLSIKEEAYNLLKPNLHYIAYNPIDNSFKPTINLVKSLIKH